MPIRIESLPEYVHVIWHGKLVSQDVALLGTEMPRIGMQRGKAPNVLHTYDEVEGSGLPFEALSTHAEQLSRIRLPNPCRSALVCRNPLAFGLARMMQMLNQNPDLQIKVFSDLEEGRQWLTDMPVTTGQAKTEHVGS